jgi:hypothetical protein
MYHRHIILEVLNLIKSFLLRVGLAFYVTLYYRWEMFASIKFIIISLLVTHLETVRLLWATSSTESLWFKTGPICSFC